jgi:hypothetical protein
MRQSHVLPCLVTMFLAVALCAPAQAQSVADAARAAKEKKQKQSGATPSSDTTPAKTKVITNDEIPEAHSDSQPASSKAGDSATAPKSGANSSSGSNSGLGSGSGSSSASAGGQSAQNALPHGPDSAHLDFKFTSSGLKRPAKAENLWMLKNTSDHSERINLKTIITGPCGYHYEKENASDFTAGQAITDNFDAELTVLSTDCAGTYRLELRASVAGKLLDSASDSINYE